MQLPRIALYVSPGWFDPWAIRWEIFNATFRGELRRAIVYSLGAGAQDQIHKYCAERNLLFDCVREVPSLTYLRLVVKPSLLIAMEKGEGVVSKYAREVRESLQIPVVLKQVFS